MRGAGLTHDVVIFTAFPPAPRVAFFCRGAGCVCIQQPVWSHFSVLGGDYGRLQLSIFSWRERPTLDTPASSSFSQFDDEVTINTKAGVAFSFQLLKLGIHEAGGGVPPVAKMAHVTPNTFSCRKPDAELISRSGVSGRSTGREREGGAA